MNKIVANLCPIRRLRKKWRRVLKWKQLSQTNDISMAPQDVGRVDLRISGSSNHISIGKMKSSRGILTLMVHGHGNTIEIGEGFSCSDNVLIVAGIDHANFGPVTDVHIRIGKQCSMEQVRIQTFNSHARIEIGERCMFSYGINLYHTDAHPVLDAGTGQVLNKVRTMRLGDHVWVGAQATILKNVVIGDDCIIGWGAVVSRSFPEPQCALAGNPASITKRGVTWDANGAAHGYIHNEI